MSHLDHCSIVWSGATKRHFVRDKEGLCQIAIGSEQGSMAGPWMYTESIKVEERLTSSLLVFVRGIDMLKAQSGLFKRLALSSDTHAYPTRHATRGLFTVQNRLWEEHSTT